MAKRRSAVLTGSPVLTLPVLTVLDVRHRGWLGRSASCQLHVHLHARYADGDLGCAAIVQQLLRDRRFRDRERGAARHWRQREGDGGHHDSISDIPATAEIVAAYLYWQTVEGGTTTPGFLQGTFRGYGVNGEKLGGDLPYSDATASGVMRFYRANVLGFLPLGTDGRRVATGVRTT